MIYLDAAATTKPKDCAIKAMMPYLTESWFNPSSLYRESVMVREAVDAARQTVANIINAEPEEIIFTSGGSESNCAAIQGFVNKCRSEGRKCAVITSKIEHKSVILCVENLGLDVEKHFLNVDKDGFIDINELYRILSQIPDRDILVSIQFANNEIGTIQRIKDISSVVHTYHGVFHTDAVQAFCHESINVKNMDIDLLSASGHKVGAPKGIGILYKKKGVDISPLIYGTQENGMRGGTENVPYIIAFAAAANDEYKNRITKIPTLFQMRMIHRLVAEYGCIVNGSLVERLSNNINVTFVNDDTVTGESLIYLLNTGKICISAGSACNSHSQTASHVLKAIGLSDRDAMRTIRITLPNNITADDIDVFMDELKKAMKVLKIEKE